MRVKRLEIQGFKSFKDKTVIYFDQSITGIVGPNGCGKSNIVDAFFWVMGEQSYKHMRGSGSDDLIFNGSSKYSPLGIAEATLVMETDAVDTENEPAGASVHDKPLHLKTKEIAVTRRLYRGGEGEYFINGVPARLKDIKELFMDTGVGAKGYSIIEQGQIGKIVNAKPEDRRQLIEEAAGIAKYKARKVESLRKMEATQGNLARLNDVIAEIERNLSSLERQAQKARLYKKYKDELIEKEMTWGRRKILVLRQQLEAVRLDREALEQELVGLRAELQTAENTIQVDQVAQVTDNQASEAAQARILQLSDELTREKSALDLSKRRQADLTSQAATFSAEVTTLREAITAGETRIVEAESEVSDAVFAFTEAQSSAAQMGAEVTTLREAAEQARQENEQARQALFQGIARSSDLTNRGASLASRIEAAETQIERLRAQAEELQVRVTTQREESERAKTTLHDTRAQRDLAREALHAAGAAIRAEETNLRERERTRDAAQRAATQVHSRVDSLIELNRAHEGFGEASKAALAWAQESGAGEKLVALADVLEVSPGYEAAMEGWLENRLEHLIANSAALATAAIDQVRTQRNGRVAVHVDENPGSWLQSTDTASTVTALLKREGFQVIGKLSDFVRVTSPNLGLDFAARVIGNVLLVEDFAPLAKFIEAGHARMLNGWAVLARDGTALDADGTLRGGSEETDAMASQLRRKRVIAELQAQANAADQDLAIAETLLAQTRDALAAAQEAQEQRRAEAQRLEIETAALEREGHQLDRAVADLERQSRAVENEREESQAEATEAREERASIETELQEFVQSREGLEAQIAEQESAIRTAEITLRERESALHDVKINEASLRERKTSLERELESTRSVLADRRRRLAEVERSLERADLERAEFSGGESVSEARIVELTMLLASSREELALVKDRLEQSSARISGALERIKTLHQEGDAKTARTSQFAIELEKINGEISHLTQNLEEKYGPGCLERPSVAPIQEEMTEPVVTAEMTAEEELALGEEVERLRERIRRLGDVNPEAIEQYEETQKRFDYLAGERADLLKSIENLEAAIEHINKTSEERFQRAFQAIADRFERLFPIIFGGGQAKLSLVYPEGSQEILDAGVEILAQPPGKKIVNIGLLSGGEKALTAVSLIFAIFMVKPSPFCVLDEVDAPLDDANIGKFNALLREMSVKSQFILITHNKKTMELNDTLYGVTMEEPGVSKMVSIQLQ